MKLTPKKRELLERIAGKNGSLLVLNVTASGGRTAGMLQNLIAAGYVEIVNHPTVVTDRATRTPAEALLATTMGIAALEEGKG